VADIKKLCILRLSSIGDVCHATALVERIQRHRPDIEITWVIGRIEHQLVYDIPNINFVIFDKSQGNAAYKKLKVDLQGQVFDALFVMQVAFRTNMAARCINARQKIGFDWARSKELHSLFTNKCIAPQQHAHVLEGFMGFADAINIPRDPTPRWHIPVPEDAKATVANLQTKLGKFIAICPNASNSDRNWQTADYAKTADYLQQKGYAVVLCGGPAANEKALGEEILQHTDSVNENLIGTTSLKHLLAILTAAELVIAPDTGPAQMATAVGTPVVGLYAHSNPLRTGPYLSLDYTASVYEQVIEEQQGKPWQQLRWGKRAKGSDLMQRISLEHVIEKINLALP
jgi:heptosyltransferase I